MRAFALFLCTSAMCAQVPEALVERLAEEAEVFRQAASRTLAEERLIQKVAIAPDRMRIREMISEYSLTTFGQPPRLHELRAVVSVDGRPVAGAAKARKRLIRGITSPGDRDRQRLLDELRRHLLADAAVVDLAPLILLFTKQHLADYRFEAGGEGFIGADAVFVTHYRQAAGNQSVLVIEKGQALRHALEGEIFSRKSDHLPLRITMRTERRRHGHIFGEEASVDYYMTPHGFVAPTAAVHRALVDGALSAENVFRYSRFQRFAASTEIKFTEVPTAP